MSQNNLRSELRNRPAEPLLPIEKKLIGWSLALGIALLIALLIIGKLYPLNV
jgi:hypothetical protein